MKKFILACSLLFTYSLYSQNWLDTLYLFETDSNVVYGTATDFAGTTRTLGLDVSYPTNDTPPTCGRPLMVLVHGGSWFAGDKDEGYVKTMREDFAKRGYTVASVNYRLGQFQTNLNVNCNIPDWNCFNMTDSSEWYRANHRGIQDVNGAIRYLINNASMYNINPNNVFVVGESAGGFIAMGVGFIDDTSEAESNLIDAYPDAPAPNSIYEANCIQTYNLASDISSMDLSRPNLGSYEGTLNLPLAEPYTIRAVGNFYGGAFNNIFEAHTSNPPALYLHHQPCDLIVPYAYNKLLAGYNTCAMGFPSNCAAIINRPYVYGSSGIKNLIDTMASNGIPTSDYLFDNATTNYNCLQQVGDPTLSCHAIQGYWTRTTNMADYFSGKIVACNANISEVENFDFKLYPNPTNSNVTIEFNRKHEKINVSVVNLLGQTCLKQTVYNDYKAKLDVSTFEDGLYEVLILIDGALQSKRLVIQK